MPGLCGLVSSRASNAPVLVAWGCSDGPAPTVTASSSSLFLAVKRMY